MRLCIALITIIAYSAFSSAEPTNVYFSGFSFVGNYSDNQRQFPHSVALLKEVDAQGTPLLEQSLGLEVRKLNRSDINLNFGSGDYRSGEAITLAFAVDWENVSIEQIGQLHKIVIDLHAQILIFDFAEMKVIGSYPVAVQVRDVSESAPSGEYIAKVIRSIYLESDHGVNIFEAFTKRLSKIPIRESFGQYLRVNSVVLNDKAVVHIPSEAHKAGNEAFKTQVAQNFGKYLSLNQNVSLLPYTKGEAIGSKMALRFSNGDVFNLSIPSPDFVVNLTVRGFKKAKVGETKTKRAWVYGSYVTIQVDQPDFNKVYMDVPFKHTVIKEVPVSQVFVDDWSAYQESMFAFFDQFSKQISKPSKKWLQKATNSKNAPEQLSSFYKILEQCR